MIPEKHIKKICYPEKAFSRIKRGETVFVSSGCAEPQFLMKELMKHTDHFSDNEIISLFSIGVASNIVELDGDKVRLNSFFVGDKSRQAFERGSADYTPAFLSEIPRMLKSGTLKVDAAIIQVTPPDGAGNCSLGVGVEVVKRAAEAAGYIIAQVNPRMPRTHGDTNIHIDQIDALVPMEEPILEYMPEVSDQTAYRIGRNVSGLVEDGATIHVGIGRLPNGVLECLVKKKDLGVHTEIISDPLIQLMQAGVVTGREKTLHPGKVVATMCMGSRKLYGYVNNNPLFEFYPTDYASDPFIIAQNSRMTSINSGIEIDLTGQICADTIGWHFMSGIGSQPDFVRGSKRSEGGKSIFVIPSTSPSGHSQINVALSRGCGIVTARSNVQYVVTEFGVVNLEGKSIRNRALALIEIAHPKFRDALLEEAKRTHYLFDDQTVPVLDYEPFSSKWDACFHLRDGKRLNVRPLRPSDQRALQKFKYSLPDDDVFLRFMSAGMKFTHSATLPLTAVDYFNHMAIGAFIGAPGHEEIMGIARYFTNPHNQIAEVAFTVHDRWRRRGIGTFLLRHITHIAKTYGIKGFRAEILAKNKAMMGLFYKSQCTIHSSYEDDLFSMWFTFDI
jgi:acyl-CoA hydrolase/GNAT superfamily N-acetyltransferase